MGCRLRLVLLLEGEGEGCMIDWDGREEVFKKEMDLRASGWAVVFITRLSSVC